ncbi:MAG: 4-(cytidine 5'-diphospho)-2-C-methyl-D-erythritol kinase [Gammaproteobacteria bacterium]|nr:4-(cytidine 5'-diphospho)-2-C-methyl-D-erythritol kinase [Gammaproteobacteria bacterium]
MLHILGRRADGYHELQTVFRLIDLCDELVFRPLEDGQVLRGNEVPGIHPSDDLCIRAARLLREHTGISAGVEIDLIKRIPMQAGLGGGSSDAATVLCVLNRLWDLSLTQAQLMTLGLSLGADVPVFIAGRNAWAEGVGERLTTLALPPQDYLVVLPDCAVSTAEIFAASDLTRSTPPLTIQRFLAGVGGNDCTAAVVRRHPQVGEALEWLRAHRAPISGQAVEPMLSGTGACVFLPCPRAHAKALLGSLPGHWRGWVVRGLEVSPLHAQLAGIG